MVRFFGGSRNNTGDSASSTTKIMRDELRKKGKITPEAYKRILQQKLNEAKAKAGSRESSSFSMCGNMAQNKRKLTKGAEDTLKLMADMQLKKELKKAAKEVVIEVRRFTNGRIDDKGKIFDYAGNLVARVNLKNGAMSTIYGQYIGFYKPKSFTVAANITEAINKNSPFLLTKEKLLKQRMFKRVPPHLTCGVERKPTYGEMLRATYGVEHQPTYGVGHKPTRGVMHKLICGVIRFRNSTVPA